MNSKIRPTDSEIDLGDDALDRALANCQRNKDAEDARLCAVDADVVWCQGKRGEGGCEVSSLPGSGRDEDIRKPATISQWHSFIFLSIERLSLEEF